MTIQLTKEQLAILRHVSGAGLITAGAGCGKTTTLLEYIVHCICNLGTEPAEFLILSFSKAASDEFKERLQKYRLKHGGALLDLNQVKIMTYEAFGYEIIRDNFSELGFDEVPNVITSTKLIGQCAAKIAKKDGANRKELMKDVTAKCQGLALENKKPLVDKVNNLYEKRKRTKNLVDFQDMVSLLLESKKRYLKEAAKKYRYLLVDELQDTNQLQAKMLVTLAKNIQTTLMVGDPKQNIYEFRGAYCKNWAFIKSKLKPKEYRLTLTQRIPKASLPFINALGGEIHPSAKLVSNVKGRPVQFVNCKDFGNEQAAFIVNEINRLTKSGEVKPEEIVCLGRTRRILSDLSIRLEHLGIDVEETYRKPTQSHLVGMRNLIRMTRFLRKNSEDKVLKLSESQEDGLLAWLEHLGVSQMEGEKILQNLPRKGWKAIGVRNSVHGKERTIYRRILNFRNNIAEAVNVQEPEKAIVYLMSALRSVLGRKHKKLKLDLLMRDLVKIKIKLRQFQSIDDINLKKLKLSKPKVGVQLSTINAAKGKEWKYVFIVNCVEGIIPMHYAKTDEALLAEKRLLYVASTRHKNALYLMGSPASIIVFKKNRKSDISFTKQSTFIERHMHLVESMEAV